MCDWTNSFIVYIHFPCNELSGEKITLVNYPHGDEDGNLLVKGCKELRFN